MSKIQPAAYGVLVAVGGIGVLVAEGANLVADVLVGTVVGTGVAMLTLI